MHRWPLGIGGCVPRLAPGNVRTRKVGIHGHRVLQLLDCAVVPGQMELPAVVRAEDERERAHILAQGAPMELARCRLQVTELGWSGGPSQVRVNCCSAPG